MKSRQVFTRIALSDNFDPNTEFEILTTAKQTDPQYGDFRYKREELEEMTANFNDNVLGKEVAVDLNHDDEGIALAWLVPGSMRVGQSKKLSGEFSIFSKLHRYTPKGEEFVETGALRYFSVEIRFKLERFINNVKKKFKNVIVGLALTNRPVIKDMSPTFSEKYNIHNPINMEDLKKLFEGLKANDKITENELSEFKTLAEKAVEADEAIKDEVAVMTKELSEKVEKDVDAKAKADKELSEKIEEKAAKLAEEAVKKILSENSDKDSKKFAESLELAVKAALKAPMKEINTVLDNARVATLSEQVNGLMLSEKKPTGFKADSKDKVLNFVKKLSNDLAEEYFELHEDIAISADFSEYGSGDSKVIPGNTGQLLTEYEKERDELMKEEKMSLEEASEKLDKDPKYAKLHEPTV